MSSNIWTSPRLIYRAPEVSDDPWFTYLSQDSLTFTQSAPFLPKPNGEAWGKSSRDWLEKCELGVLICLPLDIPIDPTAAPELDNDGKERPRPKPRPIGFVTLQASGPPGTAHHRNCDIGITLAPGFQGKGYGSEAIEWALRFGFKFAGMHRIGIGGFEYNPRALALYRRLGFKDEGVKREALFFDDRFWNIYEMGMLENEYRDRMATRGVVLGNDEIANAI